MLMGLPVSLDLDLLRSFVAIAEENSFTRAAERVGRTQSAVSLQMQRLESMLEQTLLNRGKGGSVELSAAGQALLGRAREILAMNDGILNSLRQDRIQGTIRFGVDSEFPPRFISEILHAFAARAPDVEVEVVNGVSCALSAKLKIGDLDLAILKHGLEPRQWQAEPIWQGNMRWVTSSTHQQHLHEVLPITLSTKECEWLPPWLTECLWSGIMQRAVEQSGRKHRIAARSGSTAGQLALVMAGVAVTATIETAELPDGLCHVSGHGLPELPVVTFLLLKARDPRQPMTDLLLSEVRSVVSPPPGLSGPGLSASPS